MTPLIVGNWKMHTDLSEAQVLAGQISRRAEDIQQIEVVLCPPAVFLYPVFEYLKARPRHLHLGLQNAMWKDEGQYTGEISLEMVRGICRFVILGHSERRRIFSENDEMINKKLNFALRAGFRPIVCVGEAERFHLEDYYSRELNRMKKTDGILTQIDRAFARIPVSALEKVAIAYEPLWAIGTSNAATGAYAAAICYIVKSHLEEKYGEALQDIPVLYGGSVSPGNASEFVYQPSIDGLLVGGSSIKGKEFVRILEIASGVKNG